MCGVFEPGEVDAVAAAGELAAPVANFLLSRHADRVPICAWWREVEGDQPAAHREPITP